MRSSVSEVRLINQYAGENSIASTKRVCCAFEAAKGVGICGRCYIIAWG